MKVLLKNSLVIATLLCGLGVGYAQGQNPSEEAITKVNLILPMVEIPATPIAPVLTEDPVQDAEIAEWHRKDRERFEKYRLKFVEMLGGIETQDAIDFLQGQGMPVPVYAGNAKLNWEQFKSAMKNWVDTQGQALESHLMRARQIEEQVKSSFNLKND